MRDEIDGRLWVDNRESFAAAVDRILDQLRLVSRRMVEFHFDAPWRRDHRTRDGIA